jgi:hypothetical protein
MDDNLFNTSMLSRLYNRLLFQPKDLELFSRRPDCYVKPRYLVRIKQSIGHANAQILFDPHKNWWGSGFDDSMRTGPCTSVQDIFHDENNPRLIVI